MGFKNIFKKKDNSVSDNSNENKVIGFKIIGENIKIVGILALVVVLVICLLNVNRPDTSQAKFYEDTMMKEVTVLNEKKYAENKGVLYDSIVKELEYEVNNDEALIGQTNSFDEGQIEIMTTSLNKNLYEYYTNLFSEESFNHLNNNIITNSNEFVDTDEFIQNVRDFISLNNSYNILAALLTGDGDLSDAQLYEFLQNIANNTITDEEIKNMIAQIIEQSDIDYDTLVNLINDLEQNYLISEENLNTMISNLITNIELSDEELNRLINELDEKQILDKEELLALLQTLREDMQTENDDLIKLLEELAAKHIEEDEEIRKLIEDLKTGEALNTEDTMKLIQQLTESTTLSDKELKQLIQELTESTTLSDEDLKESIDNLTDDTQSEISDIKSKSILVGSYDEPTNTFTIEQVEWTD